MKFKHITLKYFVAKVKEKTMARRKGLFWMVVALVLAFGVGVTGCDDNAGGSSGGTFVLSGIPAEYNGQFAMLDAWNDAGISLIGIHNIQAEAFTLPQISNGSVTFQMFDDDTLVRYFGNHTVDVFIGIFSQAVIDDEGEPTAERRFYDVAFSEGSATRHWNLGVLGPYPNEIEISPRGSGTLNWQNAWEGDALTGGILTLTFSPVTRPPVGTSGVFSGSPVSITPADLAWLNAGSITLTDRSNTQGRIISVSSVEAQQSGINVEVIITLIRSAVPPPAPAGFHSLITTDFAVTIPDTFVPGLFDEVRWGSGLRTLMW